MNLSPDSKRRILAIRNSLIGLAPVLATAGETCQMLRRASAWRTQGWVGSPPYLVKRAMLLAECRRIGAEWFIETGTYMGDTLWFMRRHAAHLVSIEVQPSLAAIASDRFKKWPGVEIVNDDSAVALEGVVRRVDGPALFWLDGHYSAGMTGRGVKDCPIFEELAAIRQGMTCPFSIMVDDARCFGSDPAYPEIEVLRTHLAELLPSHGFEIYNDVIHIPHREEVTAGKTS